MTETGDVARALARLKEQVRQREPRNAPTASGQMSATLRRVYDTERVSPHLPIGWPQMPRGLLAKVVAVAQKVVRRLLRWYINPIVDQQNAYNSAVASALEALGGQVERLVTSVEQQHESYQAEREEAGLRLQRLERAARERQAMSKASITPQPELVAAEAAPDLDYFRLELRYRRPQLLRDRYPKYVKHFKGRRDVLDIGCGRGEFVEMLIENGITARGIDLDPDAVSSAQERNRPVELAEAVTYLRGLADASIGGVFAAQLVEHLPVRHLAQMLNLCYRKMEPHAPIVLETLNPTCVWAMAQWFVLDPTHVWPIHSELLRLMLESAGFSDITCEFFSPVPTESRLLSFSEEAKLISSDPEAAAILNHNTGRLNQFLFGDQEYAMIAYRPADHTGDEP